MVKQQISRKFRGTESSNKQCAGCTHTYTHKHGKDGSGAKHTHLSSSKQCCVSAAHAAIAAQRHKQPTLRGMLLGAKGEKRANAAYLTACLFALLWQTGNDCGFVSSKLWQLAALAGRVQGNKESEIEHAARIKYKMPFNLREFAKDLGGKNKSCWQLAFCECMGIGVCVCV